MSKSFVRLIDYSLIPAVSLVLGKILGIYIVGWFFDIDVSMRRYADSIFSYAPQVSSDELRIISSYSDLIMYATVAVIFTVVLIRAILFHSSHIKPTLVSRLANNNLMSLVYSSYDVYHAGVVTIIFTAIANIVIVANSFAGYTFSWVASVVTIASVIMTALLLQDVYREIENIKKHPGKYQWE